MNFTPKNSAIALVAAALVVIAALVLFTNANDSGNSEANLIQPTTTPSMTLTATATPTLTPSPTPISPKVIHTALRQQAWLETMRERAVFPDIYASKDRPGPGTGRDTLRFNAVIIVTAGIDLELLTEDNILVNGSTVTLRLPPAQVRDCILDEQDSFYYDESCDIGGISTGGCNALKTTLRERALESAAKADFENLREGAFSEAEDVITEIVYSLGGIERVVIEQTTEDIPLFSKDGTCIAHVEG